MREDRGAESLHVTRRRFLIGSGAVAAGMAVYAGEIARHELVVQRRSIKIRQLPPAFEGFRIAQISDIHLDEFTEPFFLIEVVHRINRLRPDMVLLTGDFITRGALTFLASEHAAHRCSQILGTLECPLRFGVLGNHDVSVSAPMVIGALSQTRVPILQNRYVPIEKDGARMWLCGVEDPATSRPDLDLAIPAKPDGPVLLMAHEPDWADAVAAHPRAPLVDMMFSGHSHGGQVRLPVLGAMVLPPMGRIYPEGLYTVGSMQLYVNRGIGTVGLPFRLNCPPEITEFTLGRV